MRIRNTTLVAQSHARRPQYDSERRSHSATGNAKLNRLSPERCLSTVLDTTHPLVQLTTTLDWARIVDRFDGACPSVPSRTQLPGRVFAALVILRELYDLSDEQLYRQWRENPYFQYFCGFEEFQHGVPFDPILMRLSPRISNSDLSWLIDTSAETVPLLTQVDDNSDSYRKPKQKCAPKASKPASIYDVARGAGVSIKTVSLVLNNRNNVSERTAAMVRQVIAALNYKPDLAARHLAQRKSQA